MVIKEKIRLPKNRSSHQKFFNRKKKVLQNIKKQRFYYVPIHDRIKKNAEELWREDITRTDMENWLLAEKQIKYEDFMKARKNRQEEEMIDKCIRKIYNRY